jgi:hypothetical protein
MISIDLVKKCQENIDIVYKYTEEDDETKEIEQILFKNICNYVFKNLFMIINNLAYESAKFCNKFQENKGIDFLFDILNNENLLNNYILFHEASDKLEEFRECDDLMRRNIGTIVCLSKYSGQFKNEWKQCKALKSLTNYFQKTKHILDNKTYSCLAIAFVANDDEIDTIPEILDCLPEIIDMIKECAKAIETGLFF